MRPSPIDRAAVRNALTEGNEKHLKDLVADLKRKQGNRFTRGFSDLMKKSLRARLGDMPDMEDILASGEGSMSMPPEVIEQGRKLVDRGMVRMDANSPLRKKQAEVKMIRRNKVQ